MVAAFMQVIVMMMMEAATMDSMVMEQVDGIDDCCAGGEGIIIILGWRLL